MTAPPNLALPQAARWQRSVVPFDYTLTEVARLRHPTVVWWWGGRTVETQFGAYCYLCERLVATWARAWPVTVAATTAILGHRAAHQDGQALTPGTETDGTPPPVGATVPVEVPE